MISTKGRYALRVMIDLAEHKDEGYIPLKDIALRQEISKKYLEIIVRDLVSAGILKGASGRNGGYALSRDPKEYTLGEILEIEEGTLAAVACLKKGAPVCHRAGFCKTLGLWKEFDDMTHDFFFKKTLADLAF